MEHKSQKLIYAVTDVTCDVCNCSCVKDRVDAEYGTLQAYWGYDSTKDGTQNECHLCETCFGKVKDFIVSLGGTVRSKGD